MPPYPGATNFCAQHRRRPHGRHAGSVSWMDRLLRGRFAGDRRRLVPRPLPAGLHRREGREDIWRVPFDQPSAVLTVAAVADFKLAASCGTRPPATARTVIVSSRMARAGSPRPEPGGTAFRRSFPAVGIRRVVLRAAAADTAVITPVAGLRPSTLPASPSAAPRATTPPTRHGARRLPRSGASTSCPSDVVRR